MNNVNKSLSLIALVICVSVDYFPALPCRRYFKYKFDRVWVGHLSVPVNKHELPVVTKVSMRLRAVLQTKYAGLIELTQPPEISLDNIINKNSKTINYTVWFPLPSPLPMLKSIEVNNVTLCSSNLETDDPIVTDIILQHKFPANGIKLHIEDASHSITKWRKICGRSSPNLLFQGSRSDWPWLASILFQNSLGLQFLCSGNLVTDCHVLTAAHCVERYVAYTDYMIVYLGKHDLRTWGEPSSQIKKAKKIDIHHEYNANTFNADIAIITLVTPATINDLVKPICLWSGSSELRPILGNLGMIAGWGKNRSTGELNSVPRHVFLPVVDQKECWGTRKDYVYLTSERTLCAGFPNGTSLCNGDSGSGLLISRMSEDNEIIWELRGILSLSLLDPFKQLCDQSYLVFTDASKFVSWIETTVSEGSTRSN